MASTPAANGKDIEITDSTSGAASKPTDNEIGATVAGPALASAACDGGCNVISGATVAGIDLQGDGGRTRRRRAGRRRSTATTSASMPTGSRAVANASYGIYVGEADRRHDRRPGRRAMPTSSPAAATASTPKTANGFEASAT